MIVPAPLITVTNDTVTDDSTATLVCLSSISDISVSFVYQWTGPDNVAISEETDGTLFISTMGVDDAGQYMCTSTASYTGSEVDSEYVIDSMNTASVYLAIIGKLFECKVTHHNLLHVQYLIIIILFTHIQTNYIHSRFNFKFPRYFTSVYLYVYVCLYHVDIDSIIVTQTPSNVPVIGSTKEYTITCDVTVSCTGLCSDTITISWSLNGNSINSATLTETKNSPFTVSSSGTFTSTLTTFSDISLSHAGQYKCTASLITAGKSRSNTTDFDVKCKLNIHLQLLLLIMDSFYSTCPFNYCY